MNKLQKWFLIVAVWVIILVSTFVFYWFHIRPAKIMQACSQQASKVCSQIRSDLTSVLEVNRAVYSDCLRRNGLRER
jgi:hypothetical protein